MITLSPIEIALQRRPRRNRQSAAIRAIVQETHLHANQFVAPLFVIDGERIKQPIVSLPGVYRHSIDQLTQEVIELYELGIRGVDLFCVIPSEQKDPIGSQAFKENNLLQ